MLRNLPPFILTVSVKTTAHALSATIFLAANVLAQEPPKTFSPVIVSGDRTVAPYRFNGAVTTPLARGSGFVAWNKRAFFSAAHVVYSPTTGWGAPPVWHRVPHQLDQLEDEDGIQSRGYYRWKTYSTMVDIGGLAGKAFSKDVILGFAFQDLIPGTPAALDLRAFTNLRTAKNTLITGYPAENLYLDQEIEGYFLHETGPALTTYKVDFGKCLTTTLLTTGGGNSGGPVWIGDNKGTWKAGGILVGGMRSESFIYAFSSEVNSLTRAVAPMVKPTMTAPISVNGVGATSFFFPMTRAKKIPDGVHRWTDFRFNVARFEQTGRVTKVKLSLDVDTPHRGDLLILLQGPGGVYTIVHNEEGASADDLVLTDKDFTNRFVGMYPNGNWMIRVQDRLKGDVATVKSIVLEIGVEGTAPTPEP
jgi:subtilisin-like proprotein convertase family protein/V8-like Glu-specific endopeptidase